MISPNITRILVVDDESQAREQICKYLSLEIANVEIHQAKEGRAALALCHELRPRVVMSDINMPLMDGLQLLQELRRTLPEIEVVIFTGREDTEASIQALRLGASDYLRKPLDMSELVLTCRRALSRAQLVAENLIHKENLEELVIARTRELREMNKRLVFEIDERKLATRELKKSEERYQLALRAARIGGWEWIVETDELICSDMVAPLLDLSQTTLAKTRTDWWRQVHPEDRQPVQDALQACVDNQRAYAVEYRVIGSNGREIWIAENGNAIRDVHGKPLRMHGVIQDVTLRKLGDEERAKLSTAVGQATEIITITDAAGLIEYVNPAFEAVTGYPRSEVLGKSHSFLRSGRHSDGFYSDLWETITAGESWHGHIWNRKKDGSLYEEEASITPIRDERGSIVNYVAVKRDVTEEVALQRQLRQAQKMEAIGNLAGGIAHDFNNILFAIQGYSEMTAEYLADQSLNTGDIQEVLKATRRASDLVQQILTFSRRTESTLVKVRIGSIVKEVMKLLRASLPATVEVNKHILAPDALVMADPTQLHQIMMNLCTNAWHAMAESGGILDVSLRLVDLADEPDVEGLKMEPGCYARLSISDTGSGIPADIREKIFEPFFTTKEVGVGTGLGLSVVHGIVTGLGGGITVSSSRDEGTTFHVYIPSVTDVEVPSIPVRPGELHGDERVLLVDDEPQLVGMLAKWLGKLGYAVTSFTQPAEALAAYQSDPTAFDVVITDLIMPQLTGADLAHQLLAIRPELPIILCTGYTQNISVEQAERIGIRACVVKPVDARLLSHTLRSVIDGALI